MERSLESLPLLTATPPAWAERVAADLPLFLADHAFCEQQAAQMALSLAGQYAMDFELVEKVTALASEEILHFRRVLALIRRRGYGTSHRRVNRWVHEIRAAIESRPPEIVKVDRLLAAALIEARTCERFACAAAAVKDGEVVALLGELGLAEARHWRLFYDLAAREIPARDFEARWQSWLRHESSVSSRFGRSAAVHG